MLRSTNDITRENRVETVFHWHFPDFSINISTSSHATSVQESTTGIVATTYDSMTIR